MKFPIIAITGATGTGKTELAISVAKQTGAIVLPLDQLHRYKYLKEGTGLDIEKLRKVRYFGYNVLSPWEVSGPDKYIIWLRNTLKNIATRAPVIIEGGCTSYLNKLLSCVNDPVLSHVRVVALSLHPDEYVNIQRIKVRVSIEKVWAILQETKLLEERGFISESGLPFLLQCESLWKHPEHEDPTLAWAIRISAKVYCPSYLALKGKLSIDAARNRIIENVIHIQRYQDARIRAALPKSMTFPEQRVSALSQEIVSTFSSRIAIGESWYNQWTTPIII